MLWRYDMTAIKYPIFLFLFLSSCVFSQDREDQQDVYAFTSADINFLKNFSLSNLSPIPQAPSNNIADSIEAARLGRALFFDSRLSKNGKVACASCHAPKKYFTDGLALSEGLGKTQRSAPSLLGVAWSPWQYWDGRKDSLWSQALGPIEHPNEMAMDRSGFVRKVLSLYRQEYEYVFGKIEDYRTIKKLPKKASPIGDKRSQKRWHKLSSYQQDQVNRAFSNIGKVLMSYQRQLKLPASRFDDFIDAMQEKNDQGYRSILSESEVHGLRLFMGKANCFSCHNGPLFTNFEFHNIGAPESDEAKVDLGRYQGVLDLVKDEFTCLSKWSDAKESECEEMTYLKKSGPELVGAFKTPTLRNIAATAPYMQSGQFKDLKEVLAHYNLPKPPFYDREQHPNRPHFDILPLKLNDKELENIIAFLSTLTSPFPQDDYWWNPEISDSQILSGN